MIRGNKKSYVVSGILQNFSDGTDLPGCIPNDSISKYLC